MSSTGRYTDRLLEHLQEIDDENNYTVLLSPSDKWQGSARNFTALPCPYKQFSFNPFEQIGFAWQLYRLRPALVHFTMTQQPLLYFGKIITTTHDLTMLRYTRKGRFPAWVHAIRMVLYKFMFWLSHRKSRIIIVPTKFVKEDLAKYQQFTKPKTHVTYESSEPPISAKAERLKGVDKPFIFHVGSPFPHKNIDALVEAFSQVKAKNPALKLVLPGKKEFYFDQLEISLQNHPLKKDIIIPGFVSDAELKWLYENAECYVLPSLSEGFGLPGLEAMAHGCPLASSNTTCLPEVYGKAAHFFDPSSADDIANGVGEVIQSKTLKDKLVKEGRAQIKKYSWQKMAEQTLSLYKQALK